MNGRKNKDDHDKVSAESRKIKLRPGRNAGVTGNCDVRLNQVLKSLPYPFYVIDASDYTIKVANPAARFGKLTNTSTCYALTHKRDKPCNSESHPCPLERIRQTRKPVTVEHIHYDKDGNSRIVEVNAFPVFDSEGKVSQIIEYVFDITERRHAEEALKWELEVNSALSRLYEPLVSPGASIETIANIVLGQAKILTGSKHGYVSSIDPATGHNVAHTHTEMLKGQCKITGKDWKIVFPRGEDGFFPALWGHSLNSRKAFYTNSPENHQASKGIPEGHIPVDRFLSVPVILREKLVGQIALANKDGDYTEQDLEAISRLCRFYALAIQRNRTEVDLLKSEERFSQIAESAEEWIWEVDDNGLYTYASPVVEKLLGWEPSEIVGKKHFYDFFIPESREQVKKTALEIFSKKESFRRFVNFNVHKNGHTVILETSGLPILDEKGNLLGYRGLDTDITERKNAVDALQKAHDEMELRVKERTVELQKNLEEKNFIREIFGTYLSDEVASEILEAPGGIELGGEMRDMTVLVSDLRGFTDLTKAMEASKVVTIINRYLGKLIPIIMRYDGTIDEFMGDGILAFFGAPRSHPDHPRLAVACALEMQQSLQELNKENLRQGLPELEMGIGLSCGQMVVGNIGSERRKKYGAVGNAINEAFRLEERSRPGEILITDALKERLNEKFQIGSNWKANLRGIGQTVIHALKTLE